MCWALAGVLLRAERPVETRHSQVARVRNREPATPFTMPSSYGRTELSITSVPWSPNDLLLVLSDVESVLTNGLLHHSMTCQTGSWPIHLHGQRRQGEKAVATRQQCGHRRHPRDDLSTRVAFGKPFSRLPAAKLVAGLEVLRLCGVHVRPASALPGAIAGAGRMPGRFVAYFAYHASSSTSVSGFNAIRKLPPPPTSAQKWTICGRIFQAGQAPVIRPASTTVRALKSDRRSWVCCRPNLPWESDRCCRVTCSVLQRVERSTMLALVPAFAFRGLLRPVQPVPSRGLPCNAIF